MFISRPETLRAVDATTYVPNPDASDIYPDRMPESWAPTLNLLHGINLMIEDIGNILDEDYGDFMRKANGALLRLQQEWGTEKIVAQNFERLQNYIQFQPNWDTVSTRDRLLNDLYQCRHELLEDTPFIRPQVYAKLPDFPQAA